MSNQKPLFNAIVGRWLSPAAELPANFQAQVDCARCTLSTERREAAKRWADFKCCTFQPFVANFYLGAMLEEGLDPFVRITTQALLQPLGVMASPSFRLASSETPEDLKNAAHLCAFYDRGERNCSIWKYRPGECSSYYCSAQPNSTSLDALSEQLFDFEAGVAQMALAHLGYSAAEITAQVDSLNSPAEGLKSLDPNRAADLYHRAWLWLKEKDADEISSWGLLTSGPSASRT